MTWRPSNQALWVGYEAWQQRRYVDAHAFFQCALAADVRNAEAWQGLGSVEWSLQRFDAAFHAFQNAVGCASWQAVHWANLGLALRELRHLASAINVFVVATQLDPHYAPAYNEWANVLFDLGRYADALVLYEHSLMLDSSRAVVHHNQGVCHRFRGDTVLARHSFANALALDPNYAYTLQEMHLLDSLDLES